MLTRRSNHPAGLRWLPPGRRSGLKGSRKIQGPPRGAGLQRGLLARKRLKPKALENGALFERRLEESLWMGLSKATIRCSAEVLACAIMRAFRRHPSIWRP